jgi:hypothetical protein
MDIIMAFAAVCFSFSELQSRVALPAIDFGMLSNQRQTGGVMIKRVNTFIELPSLWTMACLAADLKTSTMG